MFFSNATTTAVQELAFGNDGLFLKSNGTTSAPTWSTIPQQTSIVSQSEVNISGDPLNLEGGS